MYVLVKHMCFTKHHLFSDVLVTFKYWIHRIFQIQKTGSAQHLLPVEQPVSLITVLLPECTNRNYQVFFFLSENSS